MKCSRCETETEAYIFINSDCVCVDCLRNLDALKLKPSENLDDQPKTLRDEFAMAALTGMLAANPQGVPGMNEDNVDEIMAREAYASADAMLAERKKKV